MKTMKKPKEKIKFSKLRLRASANKSKLSNSPRHPQEKISKYFSSVLTQNEDESQPSEDLTSSDSQNTIKSNDLFKTSSSTSTLDDDDGDDFVQSKVIKPAKIFDFKTTKEPKTSKQKHKKPESKFGRNINVPSCSDTNPEHMHMAIAMSKSLEDIENPDRDKTQDTEYGSTYASTQEKITRVKKTLDQFGFKSDKALSGLSSLISKKSNNLKKKYKYITPTLYLRTEEDRKIAIQTKVSAIITNISIYNDSNPHQFVVEDPEITIKKPHSFLLRKYFNCENTLFQKNGLEIAEMKPDLFYNGIVPQDSVPTGGLLRDWGKIPGREVTPPPSDKSDKKSELSTSNDVISPSLSTRTAKKDDHSELLESDYISGTLSNRNQIDFKSEREKSPKKNSLNLESTSKVIISDLDKDISSKESNSTSLNVFKTVHHGNVSPDLFSENETTDNDSPLRSNNNNLVIIPNTFSSISKTPDNLIPNIQPLDVSANIDLPQIPISPERNIKIHPDSDASVSLLDTISPHRRKNKLLKRKRSGPSSSCKKNISLEFNDSKSLSLMDSISPKRKKILQPANTNRNSVVRKNIFDTTEDETIKPNSSQMLVTDSLKTSYALLNKAKNKIEHFESFTDDLDGIFHLSNSSSDTEQVTKSNGVEPKEISHTITKLLRECNRESDQSSRSEKDSFILRINTSESFKTNQITEYKVIETVDLTQNSEENEEVKPTVETENDCLTVTQLLHECNTNAKIISKFLIKNTESFTSLVFPSINTSNNNQISVSSSSSEIENSFPSIDNEILPKKTTKPLENTLLLSSISSTDPEINSFPSIHNVITPKIGKTAIITSSDSETQIKNNQTSASRSSSENKTKNITKLSNKTIKTKRFNKRASKTSSISSNEESELELNSFPSINNDKNTKKLNVSSGENQINSFPSIENEKLPSKTKINEETSCTIISSAESETQIKSLRFNDVKNKLISSSDDDTELHSELQQKLLNSTSVILNKTKQNLFPNNPSKITGISAKTSELNNKNNLILDNNNSSSLSKLQIISLCSSDSENEHDTKTLSNVNLNNITLNTSAIKPKITSKNSEKSVFSDSDKVETNLKVSKRKINLNKTYISSSENDSESNDSVKNNARGNIKTPEKNISSHLSNSKSLISSSDNEEINLSQIIRSKKYTKTKKYNKSNELVSTPRRSLTKTTSVDETNFNKPLSPTAFCYNKFYDEDINIISFLGHVNRKELTRSEDNFFQSPNNNKTLDRSTDMSIDKRKTRSFKRFFSESIIDDNKLNYTPRKSIEISEKLKETNNSLSPSNENINLSQSLDDITISDEELNYSVRNQSKFVNDNMEFLSQSPIESNSDISDEELNYSSEKNRENKTESSFQLINHPKLKYLSTPKLTENEVLKETDKVKEQTPKSCTPQPVITPNSDLIIKTSDVTPQANYSVMDTPARNLELAKFGLKPLKRAKGIKILQHIYDATHPVAGVVEEKVRKSLSSDEDDRIIKRRKQVSSSTETIQSNLNKSYQENIDIIGDQIANSEPLNEMLFERKQSARILSCPLPLHIAWHNFVSSHKNIREKIILYEPLQVEEIYAEFKSCGFKYHIQDIITFLDRKCVTIRVAQNNHQGRKKKLAVSPKIK